MPDLCQRTQALLTDVIANPLVWIEKSETDIEAQRELYDHGVGCEACQREMEKQLKASEHPELSDRVILMLETYFNVIPPPEKAEPPTPPQEKLVEPLPALCQRWKALLADLVQHPDNPEFDRLAKEEADAIRAHVLECETCQNADLFESSENASAGVMVIPSPVLIAVLSAQLRTFMEDDGEPEAELDERESDIARLNAAVDAETRSLEATCAGFIARHPELDFEKFALPSARLSPLVAFRTADTIAMTLRSYGRRGDEPCTFLMTQTGSFLIPGRPGTAIPSSSIVNHLELCLWEDAWKMYRPSPGAAPFEDFEAFKKLNRDSDGNDLIVPRLISWLFAALKVSPGLIYGYRARPSDTGAEWILEPFAKGERINNDDKDEPWRV